MAPYCLQWGQSMKIIVNVSTKQTSKPPKDTKYYFSNGRCDCQLLQHHYPFIVFFKSGFEMNRLNVCRCVHAFTCTTKMHYFIFLSNWHLKIQVKSCIKDRFSYSCSWTDRLFLKETLSLPKPVSICGQRRTWLNTVCNYTVVTYSMHWKL